MLNIDLAVVSWLVLSWLMVLANTAGFHRLLTHRSYEARPWVRNTLTLLSAAHSGSPVLWVGVHRVHHAFSDTDLDSHSARQGFWYAHSGWLCFGVHHPLPCILFALSGFGLQVTYLVNDVRRLLGLLKPEWRKLSRDLMKEPLMRFLDMPLVIPALFAAQLGAAWAIGEWWGVLWLWSLHVVQNNASWVINSICHHPAFGTTVANADDLSRNVPWLSWLTQGDSYHAHHHQQPASALHAIGGGMDMSWRFICLLHRLGLAHQVKLPKGGALPPWAVRPTTAPAGT